MDKNGTGFHYVKEKLPHVSDAIIKEGIFVGPKIKALIKNEKFEDLVTQVESHKLLWDSQWTASLTKIRGVICPTKFISWTPTWIFSQRILVPSIINMENLSTMTHLYHGKVILGTLECRNTDRLLLDTE